MNKTTIFCLLALASGAALAQGSLTPASPPPSDEERFMSMDANANKSLSKSEVSSNSELVTRFRALDRNHDGKLSREEYALRNVDMSGR